MAITVGHIHVLRYVLRIYRGNYMSYGEIEL